MRVEIVGIGRGVIISIGFWLVAWLALYVTASHNKPPHPIAAGDDGFFIPLDTDETFSADNVECKYIVKGKVAGVLCQPKRSAQ